MGTFARALTLVWLCASLANATTRDLDKDYKRTKLRVGVRTVEAYIADTDSLRQQGLMFVTQLKADTGMIFVFEDERQLAFWMKNTLINLAIGYFNAKGELVDIQEMKATSMLDRDIPSYPSRAPALFALEMNEGWFTRNKVQLGAKLTLVGSSPSQLLNAKLARKSDSRQ